MNSSPGLTEQRVTQEGKLLKGNTVTLRCPQLLHQGEAFKRRPEMNFGTQEVPHMFLIQRSRLPIETWRRICQLLEFQDLRQVASVSRLHWHAAAPFLWQNVSGGTYSLLPIMLNRGRAKVDWANPEVSGLLQS